MKTLVTLGRSRTQTECLSSPKLPPWSKLLDGGQTCQVSGHIDSCGEREGAVGEGADTTKCRMVDLHSALTGCDNSAQCDAKRCSSNDMFARCCQPNFGPFGSGCVSRAGGDSNLSLQDGMSNPASTRTCSQITSKQRAGWSIPRMTTSGVCP